MAGSAADRVAVLIAVSGNKSESEFTSPPYERHGTSLCGAADTVREMHRIHGDGGASGEADITQGTASQSASSLRPCDFPPAGRYALHVAFVEHNGVATRAEELGRALHRPITRTAPADRSGPSRFRFGPLPPAQHGLDVTTVTWFSDIRPRRDALRAAGTCR